MKRCRGKLIIALALVLVYTGCAGIESTAAYNKPGADNDAVEQDRSDYLDDGTVLAALYATAGGFSETRYYPAQIRVPGSEETNGEYQVAAMVGDFEVEEGSEYWSDDIILESHPAAEDELEKGDVVIFTKRDAEEGLAEARWEKGVISATEQLYKGVTTVDFVYHLDRSDEGDRQYELNVAQIRIIDDWTLD